ncbi:hypothetical protein ANTQUA_LOCUS5763 [Anthophora quadrimaculata]
MDIQRFYYLTSALKSAACITKSMDISDANYKLAWANLKRRFEDLDSLVHQLNSILKILSIATQTSFLLREFIDKVNKQLVALGASGELVDSWDTFMIILLAKKTRLKDLRGMG